MIETLNAKASGSIAVPALRVLTWNVEWASPKSPRGGTIREIIDRHKPDVVCLTESVTDFLPDGYVRSADPDYGYRNPEQKRRKVVLWSRSPWRDVDPVGDSRLPTGRFLKATTDTPLGPVEFVGVCIPWADAHVRSGRKNRRRWEDHEAYLGALPPVLLASKPSRRIVLGDFNQTLPRTRAPQHLYELLMTAISGMEIVTSEEGRPTKPRIIDHLCVSSEFVLKSLDRLETHSEEGARLTDHVGFAAVLGPRPSPRA